MPDSKDLDFSLFTDRQLFDLARQVNREIARRRQEEQRLVHEAGGLVEGDRPRYRNPVNPSQTWSGRGTPPGWVHDALAGGARLASLAVNDDLPLRCRKRS